MNKKHKKIIVFSFLIISIITLSACSNGVENMLNSDTYKLNGQVIDNDNSGMDNVKIKAEGSKEVVSTDNSGNFSLGIPKKGITVNVLKEGYSFSENSFTVDRNMKKNIIAYPSKNSDKAQEYYESRKKITKAIVENYDPDNHQSSIDKIRSLIRDPRNTKYFVNYKEFNSTSKSISIKFPQGGIETWLLNGENLAAAESSDSNLNQNSSTQNTTFNESLTPENNNALIINSHYNENERNNISEDIRNELQNMGYNVSIISGNKVTANIYKDLDNYGIVYIQSYSDEYDNQTMLMSGQSVSSFDSLSDELYQLYMTKKASPMALPKNNSYPFHYWGLSSDYLANNFSSENNTIIFSASGGLAKDSGFVNSILDNGASAFISTTDNTINSESLLALIKEMQSHTELNNALENLSQSNKSNITIKKANNNEDIYISSDIDNEPPQLENIDDKVVNEGNNLRFTINASDPDNSDSELTYEANGELSEYFNPETKEFNWTPGYNDGGSYELTFNVRDKYYSDFEKVTIKVIDQPKTGTAKWKFNNDGNTSAIYNTPAINDSSTSHIYSNDYLLSVNNDGSNNLKIEIDGKENGDFQSSVVIDNESGNIYYAKDKLYAYDAGGRLKWSFEEIFDFYSQPALDNEGNIYFASYEEGKNSRLYKIEDAGYKGRNIWNNRGNELQGSKATAPAISKDDKLYIADNEGYIYSFFTKGNYGEAIKIWERKISNNSFNSNPIIAEDGSVYIADHAGTFYVLNPNGEIEGEIDLFSDPISSSPIIDKNGNAIITNEHGNLFKINPEVLKDPNLEKDNNKDSLVSPFDPLKISDKALSTPALADNNILYINSKDGNLYAIDNNSGEKVWDNQLSTNNAIFSNPSIDDNGLIHLASTDTYLYAIHGESTGPADTPWPMYGSDKYNSARRDYNSSGNDPYIILIPINYTPDIEDGKIEIAEYSTMDLVFAGGDADGDNINLSLENSTIPESEYSYNPDTRIFSWSPGHNSADNSPYELDFTAEDSEGNIVYQNLEVIVNDENVAPEITETKINNKLIEEYDSQPVFEENQQIEILVNAKDPDGDDNNISYSINGEGSEYFTQSGNTFTWTPEHDLLSNGESKNYTITVTANDPQGNYFDNDGQNKVDISFTVNNKDRPPKLNDPTKGSYNVQENNKLIINVGASDPDGDAITYKLEPINESSFTKLSQYIDVTDPTGGQSEIVIEPGYDLISHNREDSDADKTKTYSFYVVAESNGLESEEKKEIEVTVENNNQKPTIENSDELREVSLQKDENYVGFTIEGSDPDEEDIEHLQYEIVDSGGISSSNYDFGTDTGEFYWSNPSVGTHNIEVRVSDGEDYSDSLDIQINVEDFPPEFVNWNNYQSGQEGQELKFDIIINDPNNKEITDLFASSGSEFPENEIISDYISEKDSDNDYNENYSVYEFAWTPKYDQAGDYEVSFVAQTEDGDTTTESVLLSIANRNGTPSFDFIEGHVYNNGTETKVFYNNENMISLTEGEKIDFTFNFNDPDQNDELELMVQVRNSDGNKQTDADGIYIEDKLLEDVQTKYTKDEYDQEGFSTTLDWTTAVDSDPDANNSTYNLRFIISDGQETVEKVFSLTVNTP